MNADRIRRKQGVWGLSRIMAGVVIGAIFTVLFSGWNADRTLAGGNWIASAQAAENGATDTAARLAAGAEARAARAVDLMTGGKDKAEPANIDVLRNEYGAVPGVVPPMGTYDGADVSQPINFSHKIHAGDNQINCLYCHTYARRSKVSGIPPTSKCMGCHSVIATDKPEIEKLTAMWESGKAPVWKKVHDLPDFVHFTHQRHLKRFLFDNPDMTVDRVHEVCAMCHGDVKKMTVAKKSKPLTMGFCVDCHQANQGPSDCAKCHK